MLSCHIAYDSGEGEAVRLICPCPRCKVSHLAIISIVCKPHLWADVEDFPIEQEESAVVERGTMEYGHADVTENAVRGIGGKDLS